MIGLVFAALDVWIQRSGPIFVHQNRGILFDLPVAMPIVLVLSVLVIIFLVWQITQPGSMARVWLFWILLGALGNTADRFFDGFVTDYWRIYMLTFNLSDLLIVGGLLGLAKRART